MNTKDKFLVGGVLVIIILNIILLGIEINQPTVQDVPSVTGGALLIQGSLNKNANLDQCCEVAKDEGCYVLKGSSCKACGAIC